MKKVDTSLLCLETGSIAYGYRALKAITDASGTTGIRVLDASPAGARFLILALGETSLVRDAEKKARASLDGSNPDLTIEREILENVEPELVEAIFNLPQVELEEALLVIESASVSGCLSLAQRMIVGHQLKVIEIRIQRSSTGGAYAFLTGSVSACGPAAAEASTDLRESLRQGVVEVIENPSLSFRSFFNLSGKA